MDFEISYGYPASICVSVNDEVVHGIPNKKHFLKEGDIVLLLGKGHEDYQEINGERFPFDERVVIQEVLEELEREGKTWLK